MSTMVRTANEFQISGNHFFSIFTTIDPETYEKDKEGEPLKSLKKFRLASGEDRKFIDVYKNSPLVGMNTVLLKTGKISVGDDVILTSY